MTSLPAWENMSALGGTRTLVPGAFLNSATQRGVRGYKRGFLADGLPAFGFLSASGQRQGRGGGVRTGVGNCCEWA